MVIDMMELIKRNILNILSIILGIISLSQTFTNDLDWKIIILLSSGWSAALLNVVLIFYISNKNDKNVQELAEKNAEIQNLQERIKNNELISTFLVNNIATHKTTARRISKGKE